ncbi:MAG: hypothetical protein Q9169_003642 [Polycauliona sp. 2 TL-2023]
MSMIVWIAVFDAVLVIILVLRYYAARLLQRSFRLDDGFVAVACVRCLIPYKWFLRSASRLFSTVLYACNGRRYALGYVLMLCTCRNLTPRYCTGVVNGLGAHADQLDAAQSTVQIKLLLSATWTWTIATVSCKLAILSFYNVIFTFRRFRILSYALMGACLSYVLMFIPIFMTQCRPIAAAWNPSLGQCKPIERQEFASVSINMVLDLMIVVLPMPTLWSLQMPRRRKALLSIVFGLGLFSVTSGRDSKKDNGTMERVDGGVPLQHWGFNTLEGESAVGLGDVGHWANAESNGKDEEFALGMNDRLNTIAVRTDFDVLAEPKEHI